MSTVVADPEVDEAEPAEPDASNEWSPLVYRVARTAQGLIFVAIVTVIGMGFAGVGPLAVIGHAIHDGLVELKVIDEPTPFDPLSGYYGSFPGSVKPDIGEGATGDSVLYLEAVLTQHAGQTLTTVDDVYGPDTTAALRGVQAFFGLPQTGVVDAATWDVIDGLATQPAS